MGKGWKPDRYLTGIYQIVPEELKASGIDCVFLDIDNTLVPNHTPDADDRVIHFVNRLKVAGIQPIILSNAQPGRVARFNRPIGLKAVSNAWKPSRKAYAKALAMGEITAERAAMIGDQLFTDIIGGNRCGLFTILVQPMSAAEPFWVKWKRIAEKWFLRGMKPLDRL